MRIKCLNSSVGLFIMGVVSCQAAASAEALSFASPSAEAHYDIGALIPLQVKLDAAREGGIKSVKYYDGASLLADICEPPFHFAWNTATRGTHTIRAVAVDAAGGKTSGQVTLTVNDPTPPVDLSGDIDAYSFTFDTLGVNARDSMPLGNGDISLNVWTYPNGDVGLLIGKLDAFAQTGNEGGAGGVYNLRKIGRVRISMEPSIFKEAADAGKFKQTLVLSEAAVRIQGEGSELKVWVDKNSSVIHTELSGNRKVVMTVKNDPWRTSEVKGEHVADIVFPDQPNQVIWCYHDPRTHTTYRNVHEGDVIKRNLPGAQYLPRYTTVTFGALIEGVGLTSVDSMTLRSKSVTNCRADINVLRYSKEAEATPANWLPLIKAQAEKSRAVDIEAARKEHLGWWRNFWDRSYIIITSGEQSWKVTSFYLHQRFIFACQAGALQETWRIPFNGGIFNVDFLDVNFGAGLGVNFQNAALKMTADFRFWGSVDRAQNTRHIYWPMLMAGDYDLARVWYQWPAIVAQSWEKAVENYSGKKGCVINTGIAAWEGLGKELFVARGEQYLKRIVPEGVGAPSGARPWAFDTCDEYLPYMLDYYELTQDDYFLQNALLPYAEKKFRFFDEFFPRERDGKLILWPCQQSEVYVRYPETGFVPANPVSGVALLHTQLPRLLALKGKPGVTAERLALWQKIYAARPAFPVGTRRNGQPGLLPHEAGWDEESKKTQGHDRATLYAIWPYRAYMFPATGISKEDYQLARNTFQLDDNGSLDWMYGDYCAAILGLAERAKSGVIHRMNGTTPHGSPKSEMYYRFPPFQMIAFPNYPPNMEGGGVMEATLQYMLWNWKGDTIYVCPAWPKDWDCKFKFHGPRNTVVAGHVTGGEVTIDTVVPESRRKDIIICEPQESGAK